MQVSWHRSFGRTWMQPHAPNQTYQATFPALEGKSFDVSITEIGAQAEAANAFPVTLQIASASTAELKAGMSAEVDFAFLGKGIRTGFSGDSIRVPNTALMTGEDDAVYAFVYDSEQETVSKRKVLPENIVNNEVIVTQGLKPGEIVATAGVDYLHDGQKVRLLDESIEIFNR